MFTVNGHRKAVVNNERHLPRCFSSLFDATRTTVAARRSNASLRIAPQEVLNDLVCMDAELPRNRGVFLQPVFDLLGVVAY
jgi:hypothetical protein